MGACIVGVKVDDGSPITTLHKIELHRLST